jgi:hypothetical protein
MNLEKFLIVRNARKWEKIGYIVIRFGGLELVVGPAGPGSDFS